MTESDRKIKNQIDKFNVKLDSISSNLIGCRGDFVNFATDSKQRGDQTIHDFEDLVKRQNEKNKIYSSVINSCYCTLELWNISA